ALACSPAGAGGWRVFASAMATVRQGSPTRPHPGAPDRPPANKLLAPGAGMVGRLKDMLTGRRI
ncbi:MAG: hemerythrin domain-containing protein, partial [Pseudonocardia sp.]|nr:hemerythrin domain-containing protein [Pseudonocardia sp.]